MKTEDRYLKFVRWSEQDGVYVGYCPDLFMGGVCDDADEERAYRTLVELVRQEVAQLMKSGTDLPAPMMRPMRELGLTDG